MKIKKLFIILTLSVLLCACESILSVDSRDAVNADEALSKLSNYKSMLISSYDALQEKEYYGRDFIAKAAVLSDNGRITLVNTNRFVEEYNATEGSDMFCWEPCYTLILRTNYIINNIDKVEGDIDFKDRIKGEALFLRALAYHDLLRSYSREPEQYVNDFNLGVPIVTETFKGKVDELLFPKRNTVEEGYRFVERDLNKAFLLLEDKENENYPYTAGVYAVKALLSRVFLYQGKWDEAVAAAGYVIEKSGKTLERGKYSAVFEEQSESIFSLAFTKSESLVFESLQSLFAAYDNGERTPDGLLKYTGVGYGDIVPADALLNDMESADKRSHFFIKVLKENEIVYWTKKYGGYKGTFGADDVPILRISEVYLNRAEAYMHIPDGESKALEDINELREARNLPRINAQDDALNKEIELQRRIELAFEGHRFFDIKRRGKDIVKQSGIVIKNKDHKMVSRIPIEDTDLNKNLIQNPEY